MLFNSRNFYLAFKKNAVLQRGDTSSGNCRQEMRPMGRFGATLFGIHQITTQNGVTYIEADIFDYYVMYDSATVLVKLLWTWH